jgi:hypothetical protein
VTGFEDFMAEARRWTVAAAARECAVPEPQIRELAEWYHTISPAAIAVGNGLERNQNGGSGVRAVFALPALAGKWGVPGGGLVNGAGHVFVKTPAKLARPDLVPAGTRTLNIIDAGRHLLDLDLSPPIRALFFYNHNPLIVHPDQNRLRRGLARPDLFTVGIDVVMTDSLAYADVVLPACSHFEYHDLYAAYGAHWLQRAEPVIPPVGESLPNSEIFRRLAARFGFDDPCFRATDHELMDDAVDPADPRLGGVRPSALPLDRALSHRHVRPDECPHPRHDLPVHVRMALGHGGPMLGQEDTGPRPPGPQALQHLVDDPVEGIGGDGAHRFSDGEDQGNHLDPEPLGGVEEPGERGPRIAVASADLVPARDPAALEVRVGRNAGGEGVGLVGDAEHGEPHD